MSLYKNWFKWTNREALQQIEKYITKSSHTYSIIESYKFNQTNDSQFLELIADDITEYSSLHSILEFLNSVSMITNYSRLDEELEKHINLVDSNKLIYNKLLAYSKIYGERGNKSLNTSDAALLLRILNKFSSCCDNPETIELRKKQKKLEQDIEQNFTNDRTNIILLTEEELDGVNKQILQLFEKDINEGRYIIHLDDTTFKIFMSTIKKSLTRKKIEIFYSIKCYELINKISELVVTRDKLAKLEDYNSYPDMQGSNSILNSFDSIMKFTRSCIDDSNKLFSDNVKILKELKMRDENENDKQFGSWDIDYYMNIYKTELGINQTAIKSIFSIPYVITSTINIFENLFKIKFVKQNITLWDTDVSLYNVMKGNEVIGNLYLDLIDKPNKNKKTICYVIESSCMHFGSNRKLIASVVITAAFSPQTFDYDNINSLFREFGYALHNMFGYHKYYLFSGTNVAKDYLDLPGLLLEYVCWDSKIIKLMTNKHSHFAQGHKRNGTDPNMNDIINKLKYYKSFVNSIDFQRQLVCSVYDQLIYTNDFIQGCHVDNLDSMATHFIHLNDYVHNKIYKNSIYNNQGTIMPYKLINNYDDASQLYSYLYPKIISANILYKIVSSSDFNFQDLVQNVILKLYDNKELDKNIVVGKLLGSDSFLTSYKQLSHKAEDSRNFNLLDKIKINKYFELLSIKPEMIEELKKISKPKLPQNNKKSSKKKSNITCTETIDVNSSDIYQTETTESLKKYSNIFVRN